LKSLEDRWEEVVGILGNEAFPEFLRVYWNSCNRIVRKTELFKVIRTRVRDRESAFGLIRQLVDCARIYAAIRDPNDGLWNDAERDHLANLKLYNVRQHYPLLLAAYRKWGTTNRSDFTRVLCSIDILSFRYNENAEEDFIYRLGNLTLMAASENRDLGKVGYETKRSVYESSVFAITRKIAEDYAEWNSDKIVARQNWLARQVVMLWRVEF